MEGLLRTEGPQYEKGRLGKLGGGEIEREGNAKKLAEQGRRLLTNLSLGTRKEGPSN